MDKLTRRPVQRAHGPVLGLALLSVALVAATGCAAFRGAGATPSPTTSPTPAASPLPTATPLPSATADATDDATISHPTGATDVVLRMENGGGFVPPDFVATQIPQFTLYGDGTVVFRPLPTADGATFGDPLPAFQTGNLSEEAVQELLAYALTTGRLENAKPSYDNGMIADASTTTFELNVNGDAKQVAVYALTETTEPGPDAADRNGMAALAARLMDFGGDDLAASMSNVQPYAAETYRVTMYDSPTGEPVGEPAAWPWRDVAPSDFAKTDGPGRVAVLSSKQVSKLTSVPNGGQVSIWAETPNGDLYSFSVRPLLPDESSSN